MVKIEDELNDGTELSKIAIVQVPSVIKRFIQVSTTDGSYAAVLLEDIIIENVSKLFHGYQVKHANPFRITRNADLTIHEEGARDLLIEIEKELKKRKWGAVSRLEVKSTEIKQNLLHYLLDELEICSDDVFKVEGPLDVTFLFSFIKTLEGRLQDCFMNPLFPNHR